MSDRRAVRAATSPLSPPAGRPVLPAEFQYRPTTGPIADYVEWRERRRAWFASVGALTDNGALDWRLVERGPAPR